MTASSSTAGRAGLSAAAGWAQARLRPQVTAVVEARLYELTTSVELAAFDDAGAPVVGETYGDGQYWHDSRFEIPQNAVRAEVTLYYQSTPREYIEALRDENFSNHWGDTLHAVWEATGRGTPVAMASSALATR